jgi:two-component system CheB/CheR fusion protein
MVAESSTLPVEHRERLEVIRRSSLRLLKLVNTLLDFSRIESGRTRPGRVLEAALDAVRPAAEAREIAIELSLGDGERVSGDPQRLQQVFWNVLSNAIKFTPPKGSVGVAVRRDGDFVDVKVRDDGEGMEASFLPHAFERFRQADATATRARGGLGLGLSITRQIVELHGGTIALESSGRGEGTTVTVRLPIRG